VHGTGNRTRIIVGLILLAVSAGLGGWVVWRWRTGAKPAAESDTHGAAESLVSIKGSVLQHSQRGRLNWSLAVEDMELSAGGRTVSATGLKDGLIYDASGRPVLRLTASRAKYNTVRKDFELTGEVKAVSHKGAVITTDKVQWLPKEQTLRCPDKVTMRAEDITITADHLDLMVAADMVKCTDRVRLKMGENRLTGRNLSYNLNTKDFTLDGVQAVFAPETVKEKLEELR